MINPTVRQLSEDDHSSIPATQREILLDAISENKHYHRRSKIVEEGFPHRYKDLPTDKLQAILDHARASMVGPKHRNEGKRYRNPVGTTPQDTE